MKLFDRSNMARLALLTLALMGACSRPSVSLLPAHAQAAMSPATKTPQEPEKDPVESDDSGALPLSFRGKVWREHPAHFDKKLIALTFDDGPDPQCTPQVLDILAKYNAHATFFVVGVHIPGHEKLLQRMIAEGHVVGNHTYAHPLDPPAGRARLEITRTEALIIKATGHAPTCFRPPYGKTNSALVAQAKRQGYGVFLWTIDPGDTRGVGTRGLIRGTLSDPEKGDILLLHDGIGHQASVDAVEPILEALSAKGWQFVTLPEMMAAWDAFRKTHPKSLQPHKTILSSATKAHRKTKTHRKKTHVRKPPAKAKRAPKPKARTAPKAAGKRAAL